MEKVTVPTPESYEGLSETDLRVRLALAEQTCVLFGWSGGPASSPSHDAVHQAWSEWADVVGSEYTGPKAHPDLNEGRIYKLVTDRHEIRERTLAAIRLRYPNLVGWSSREAPTPAARTLDPGGEVRVDDATS